MEMSADHSTTEPTDNSADTDQSKTESDRAETADGAVSTRGPLAQGRRRSGQPAQAIRQRSGP